MEMLSNEFNNLLTQYQETYQEFINVINSNTDNLTSVPNSAFIGQSNIETIQNSSINNCLSSCNSTSSCSGATFNNQLQTCTLSKGNGIIVDAQNQTAIVKQALYYSNQLRKINIQLLDINRQMVNISENNVNNYNTNYQEVSNKAKILSNNYQILEQERGEIDDIIRQYDTLNSALENGNINVTANYYKYITLFIIAIFLVFILLKYSVNNEQRGGSGHLKMSSNLLLMFFLLSAVIIFNSYIKK